MAHGEDLQLAVPAWNDQMFLEKTATVFVFGRVAEKETHGRNDRRSGHTVPPMNAVRLWRNGRPDR
jgi:hypothetical protein